MRITTMGTGIGLVLFLASAACGRGEIKGPEVAETTSSVVGNEGAIDRITAARCDREVACNNVGAGKSYGTREACMNELGHNKRADLNPEECGRGISEPDLNDCLHDIRDEKCGNPLDSLSRLAACRKAKLCLSR